MLKKYVIPFEIKNLPLQKSLEVNYPVTLN